MVIGVFVPKQINLSTLIARFLLEASNTHTSYADFFVLILFQGIAVGTFVYVATFEMLAAELLHANDGMSGLIKVAFVLIGFIAFLICKYALSPKTTPHVLESHH